MLSSLHLGLCHPHTAGVFLFLLLSFRIQVQNIRRRQAHAVRSNDVDVRGGLKTHRGATAGVLRIEASLPLIILVNASDALDGRCNGADTTSTTGEVDQARLPRIGLVGGDWSRKRRSQRLQQQQGIERDTRLRM